MEMVIVRHHGDARQYDGGGDEGGVGVVPQESEGGEGGRRRRVVAWDGAQGRWAEALGACRGRNLAPMG